MSIKLFKVQLYTHMSLLTHLLFIVALLAESNNSIEEGGVFKIKRTAGTLSYEATKV